MAAHYDYFVTGSVESTKDRVRQVFESQGFAVTEAADGNLRARRGSTAATVLWGGLAGKKMTMSFDIQFFVDAENRAVARVIRDLTSGALKGGAIGAKRTADAFEQIAAQLRADLTQAGILAGVSEG